MAQINENIIRKAWEIRKKGTHSLKELAEYFGVDPKDLQEGIGEIAKREGSGGDF